VWKNSLRRSTLAAGRWLQQAALHDRAACSERWLPQEGVHEREAASASRPAAVSEASDSAKGPNESIYSRRAGLQPVYMHIPFLAGPMLTRYFWDGGDDGASCEEPL